MTEIKVAIIGYGGIARTHTTAYCALAGRGVPVRLVAVCDQNIERIKTKTDINLGSDSSVLSEDVHLYTDIDSLLEKEDFDAADICLPSFLHADVSIKCLLKGKHVLCEKPMALSSEDSLRMVEAAKQSGRELMIGHCCRFMPGYLYLRECILTGVWGKLEGITMNRHTVYPTWGAGNWHGDKSKCGGCLIDTHIHDVDVARFLLGEPDYVSSAVLEHIPHYQYVNTRLLFGDVTAIINGSWDHSYTQRFSADYRARFEKATVFFDFETVTVFPNGQKSFCPDLPKENAYEEEIHHFIDLIQNGGDTSNTAEDAHNTLLLIEAIAESAERGGAYLEF